jgi:hypothetical protein
MKRAAELGSVSSKRTFPELIGKVEWADILRAKQLHEWETPRVIGLCVSTLG